MCFLRLAQMSSVVVPAVLAMAVVQPGVDPGNVTLGILGTYLSYEQKVQCPCNMRVS